MERLPTLLWNTYLGCHKGILIDGYIIPCFIILVNFLKKGDKQNACRPRISYDLNLVHISENLAKIEPAVFTQCNTNANQSLVGCNHRFKMPFRCF